MFIVQNIWRRYSGWWDGHVSHLKPVPHAALARSVFPLRARPMAFRELTGCVFFLGGRDSES